MTPTEKTLYDALVLIAHTPSAEMCGVIARTAVSKVRTQIVSDVIENGQQAIEVWERTFRK